MSHDVLGDVPSLLPGDIDHKNLFSKHFQKTNPVIKQFMDFQFYSSEKLIKAASSLTSDKV